MKYVHYERNMIANGLRRILEYVDLSKYNPYGATIPVIEEYKEIIANTIKMFNAKDTDEMWRIRRDMVKSYTNIKNLYKVTNNELAKFIVEQTGLDTYIYTIMPDDNEDVIWYNQKASEFVQRLNYII